MQNSAVEIVCCCCCCHVNVGIVDVGIVDIVVCRRAVSAEEAQAWATENGLLYVEASAKSAEGVEAAFMRTAASIWEKTANGHLVLKAEEVRCMCIGCVFFLFRLLVVMCVSKCVSCLCVTCFLCVVLCITHFFSLLVQFICLICFVSCLLGCSI